MLTSLIVDDEKQSRDTLRAYLKKYCTEIDVTAEADSVKSALKHIKQFHPELIFLDVELPDGTGFDILEKAKNIPLKVIFISAYDKYAVRAFKFSAIDYLQKPFEPDDIVKAVSKIKMSEKIDELKKKIEVLLVNRNSLKKIALPSAGELFFVNTDEIVRCKADRNYTKVFLSNGKTYLTSKTLREYDEMLSPLNFCRIHHSHLINISFIKKYIKGEGGTVIMEDDSEIDVSRRRKEFFLSKFMK